VSDQVSQPGPSYSVKKGITYSSGIWWNDTREWNGILANVFNDSFAGHS